MISIVKSSLVAIIVLASSCIALPAGAAAPTCQAKKMTFDELPRTNGFATGLPGDGYDYQGLAMTSGSWRYVSSGLQWNGDSADNDRPVPHPPDQQQSKIIPHSGINAIIQINDGPNHEKMCIDSANYAGGHRYYDFKSLWVTPEYPGKAFQLKTKCYSYHSADDKEKVWNVPALAEGSYYQIKFPTNWTHLWRCEIGALNEQQIILDDIEYCLWDFPYSVPIPW